MTAKVHLDRAHALALLRDVMRIRESEAACAGQYQAPPPEDCVVATYREHGEAIARGIPMRPLMAEMFGRLPGCSRGRGGSMHVFDRAARVHPGNARVGGGPPLAVGIALADRVQGRAAVTACFFGEGAADEGVFHESLNLTSLRRLPVLFVCENNRYCRGTRVEVAEADAEIWRKAAGCRMHGERADGMDVVAVEVPARGALERIRAGEGPVLLECATTASARIPRSTRSSIAARPRSEAWRQRGPILRFRKWLQENGSSHAGEGDAMAAEIRAEVADAVAFAAAAPREDITDRARFVTMGEVPA